MAIKQKSKGKQAINIVAKKGDVNVNKSNSPAKEHKTAIIVAAIGAVALVLVAAIGLFKS